MKPFIAIIVLLLATSLSAQETDKQLIFELRVDNDMTFFTDHYYSSGIELKVYAGIMQKSPLNKILLPAGSGFKNYYAFTLKHKLYTPVEIYTPQVQGIDHPYASYLLIGNQKESFSFRKRLKIISAIEIGVMGTVSGGGYFQNTLHRNIAIAYYVEGWDTQVGNDFCIQYSTMLEKGMINLYWFELNAYVGAKLGVPHTEAQIGSYMRIGKFEDYFKNIGLSQTTDWQFWLFATGDIFIVNYNAAIQGGPYNQTEGRTLPFINSNVFHTRFGGTLVYKTFKIEIGQEVVSPTFPTGMWHRWAYISLMLGF